MLVKVRWRNLIGFEDEGWRMCRCLYAYTTTNSDEILYIGKADRASIYDRWKAKDKEKLFLRMENERKVYQHIVSIGCLELEFGKKFSWQMLSDVESLLINYEQPWGNDKCKNTRISRPNLEVKCVGNWIGNSKTYLDY